MPEPLTIATAVIGIVASSIKGLDIALKYATTYKTAGLRIHVLLTNCKALEQALQQIRNLLSDETLQHIFQGTTDESRASFRQFEDVFGCCEIIFKVLQEKLSPLLSAKFETEGDLAKRSKLAAVWNDSSLSMMSGLVRDGAQAVHILFDGFKA